MKLACADRADPAAPAFADRIGFARLTTSAFNGADLRPLSDRLMAKIAEGTAEAGEGMDLSLISQLLGDKATGLAIQKEVLSFHRLFRSPSAVEGPTLRVLALAAAIDMGGNTPIEFLLQDSSFELLTLYVVEGTPLPNPLPAHDVAIVIASDSEECRAALAAIDEVAERWPRPLLNLPRLIGNLDRDKLHRQLAGIEGLHIPTTLAVTRAQLFRWASEGHPGLDLGFGFPVIVRPRGSHAGAGLARLESGAALADYLAARPEAEFFVSAFVDYASPDGLFRKYRVVMVDGRPYPCHMAIADRWDIWYLNAEMAFSESKRREEASFMETFDSAFALRHRGALAALFERVGLDYFTVDCAEDKDGNLLVFEADNTAVVHNMDSPELYPYKPPQMRRIFTAFAAMLERHARLAREPVA